MQEFKINEVVGTSIPAVSREKIVNSILANQSNFAGDTPPSSPVACMFWADTQNAILWQRSLDNTEWINKGPIDSQLATDEDAQSYAGGPNLYLNSTFRDWDDERTLPRYFYTYYNSSALSAEFERIAPSPSAAEDSDEYMAYDLLKLVGSDINRIGYDCRVLKVTLQAGSGSFSLNQRAFVAAHSYVTSGCLIHVKTTGAADVRFKDDPWPLTEKALSSEDFNKNINFYNHSKTSGPGGDLGFNIFVANPSETTVLYIALPWLCIGYADYWRDNPINIITHTKRKILSENSGYSMSLNGVWSQWNTITQAYTNENVFTVNFPVSFPIACTNVVITALDPDQLSGNDMLPKLCSRSQSSFQMMFSPGLQAAGFSYFATGY
ncbi:hypothetical protein Psal073_03220 (plasmid) [Piscirickettsia salmonis]|uniref:gp53-like domain-containing protein n=1 Tax=Piscirickettsia salmonis TaxID=1238 RepID=UPI00031C4875|nr:hypothetical protein [Piscirickettsia salmonis]QGO68216.1 hypothetical protein Psal073_03220 [Piscirickettsia salmonis]